MGCPSADERGTFSIRGLARGRHALRVLSRGYWPAPLDFVVRQGGAATAIVAMRPLRTLRSAEVLRVPIGADVTAESRQIRCDLIPDRATLRIGRTPRFRARLRNRSDERISLPRFLQGSDVGRSPRITITIAGPAGGCVRPPQSRCGNLSTLLPDDFVDLAPGESFDPLANGWSPETFDWGTIRLAGRYTATLRYSTEDANVGRWLGEVMGGVSFPFELATCLRRTPRIEVTRTITFTVTN